MSNRRKEIVGGILLIGAGIFVLLATMGYVPNLGLFFLPAMGTGFLLWGILSREEGLIIPGGILSGIGWGVYLMNGPFDSIENNMEQGGIFLLSFACGFGLITLFTALFTDETHWWALIPGGIIGVVGVAVLTQGALLTAVSTVGKYWPVVLIGLGIYILFKAIRQNEVKEKSPQTEYVEEKYKA